MHEIIHRLHRRLYLFPVVLLCAHTGLSLYHLLTRTTGKFTFYLLTAGLATGWLSFATGMIILFSLRASKIARGLAFIHGFINSMALLVLTLLWAKDTGDFPSAKPPEVPAIAFKLLTVGLLLAGAFLGKSTLRKHLR